MHTYTPIYIGENKTPHPNKQAGGRERMAEEEFPPHYKIK